ncbi:MAG TPA: ferric reductase-like transmembrane domain-containing protein [Ktedonobacterales bacterium]|nr:ferric reductase-like transmembrane domain-containing protein [Ktedonobacterales bacterium]
MNILFVGGTAHTLAAAAQSTASPALWYITRAAAVSAYLLLTLTVALGILRSLARDLTIRAGWTLDEIHQFLALLTGAFVLLHLGTLVLDPYIPFSLANLIIPVAQPYRSFATDLGVLALYTLAVVLVSSWLRRRMSYRVWRGVHYASFITFFLVTLHGLLAGADAAAPWMHAIYIGSAAAVVFLVFFRILAPAGDKDASSGQTAK